MLQNVFMETIHRYDLLEKDDRVLVACSGGPDSMALLTLLREIVSEYRLSLFIAHLNHGIRENAGEDEAFLRMISQSCGIGMVCERIDCPALKREWKISLEGAARRARYDFFKRQAYDLGVFKVALGHTADDQAETMLMRLFRGSGLQGLTGIPFVRKSQKMTYIRPLLKAERKEILHYLRSREIPYITDTTNLERCCTRNRIRLDLLPLIKREFNPSIVSTLSRTADLLREDHRAIHSCMGGINAAPTGKKLLTWKDFISPPESSTACLDIDEIRSMPLGIQRRVIMERLMQYMGAHRKISYRHIESVLRLIATQSGGGELNLPEGVVAYRLGRRLFFEETGEPVFREGHDETVKIPGGTELEYFDLTVEAALLSRDDVCEITQERTVAYFDLDTLALPIQVRARIPGDRFHPLGMHCKKKLKEFFIDNGIPRRKRDEWPLLAHGPEIFWVMGCRIGHPFRVTDSTTRILRIAFH